MSATWAVVPAAGVGRRIGSALPKQYLSLNGVPMLEHTLQGLLSCTDIRGIVVVLDPNDNRSTLIDSLSNPRVSTALGGPERADSVLLGLQAVAEMASDDDWVLVHDAARPCLSSDTLGELINRCYSEGVGAVLAQPSLDTLKRVSPDNRVIETLDRRVIWRAQTPQMFRLVELTSALSSAAANGTIITDESMAMELAGYPVSIIEGPSTNIKVTLPKDVEFAELILRGLSEDSAKGVNL